MPTTTPSLQQLQKALALAEQIQKLEEELAAVMGAGASTQSWETGNGRKQQPATPAQPQKRGGKRFVSAEARAKMSAAAKARYARKDGAKPEAPKPATAGKKKRRFSPEVRARLAAAMKARWAAAKRKGAPALNAKKK